MRSARNLSWIAIVFFAWALVFPAAGNAININDNIQLTGDIRFTYDYNDVKATHVDKLIGAGEVAHYSAWDERDGTFDFTMFSIGFKGDFDNGTFVNAKYAEQRKTQYIKVAEFGYKKNNHKLTLGITQVPFGIEPYDFHNIGTSINRYLGFNNDVDTGVKYEYRTGPWALQAGFFKTTEYKRPDNHDRYSYDISSMSYADTYHNYYFWMNGDRTGTGTKANMYNTSGSENNEEENQFNLKATYTWNHKPGYRTEFGAYGMWGQIYNNYNGGTGDRWAVGGHINGNYGPWNIQLEAVSYDLNPNNQEGASDDAILYHGILDIFYVATRANLYTANIAYTMPVDLGPITHISFHNDYNIMVKDRDDWPDSQMNATGMMLVAGKFLVFIDYMRQKNFPTCGGGIDGFAGAYYANPYFPGSDDWATTFKIDFGFYF